MSKNFFDIIIIGGGMVGLSTAFQLINRKICKKILIIDKESKLGLHSSGRNSGVLHAGLYYKPNSLKAKVCIEGAKRLKEWIIDNELSINNCGKIIVPQKLKLDPQIDLLYERGKVNGAKVEIINEKELKMFIPQARSASGRALWSPNTSVVNPKQIIDRLKEQVSDNGVKFILGKQINNINPKCNEIIIEGDKTLKFGHLINCAGLGALNIANFYGLGKEYNLIPFKGLYWDLIDNSNFNIKHNLYPVPDLDLPFLGVHFTPDGQSPSKICIGPTAVPALGIENYKGIQNIQIINFVRNVTLLSKEYLLGNTKFRNYVNQQAFHIFKPFVWESAKLIIPELKYEDLRISKKVGIRPQLFNKFTRKLEDDFICNSAKDSTHILNAISPAFTASFEFADTIIDKFIASNEL